MNTDAIRDFSLWARALLVQEASDLLRAVYGLKEDGTFFPAKDMPALQADSVTQGTDRARETGKRQDTRRRLEQLLADENDADVKAAAAVTKLVKEVAFTHLNRLVAFKMLEHPERRVVKRAAIAGYPEPNGFRMYVPECPEDYALYQLGTAPLDELGESPRDRAYRHFLLRQCGQLANEVRILFDPDNLASRLFPRPNALRQLIERLNGEELKDAWETGNEETVGWVYQFFIAEEKAAAFARVFNEKKKFLKEDIPAATQVFTPRWIVKFLVQNSLGRLWLSMHPDSALAAGWDYLVPPAGDSPLAAWKSVKEIHLLDPATGTMHFGLVAFDLLVSMYQEEIANVGKNGWPTEAPVSRDDDIPASILANNLFGIDIDLRAVQLSALALYIRAKSHHRDAVLTDSNLACADVTMFRGAHRSKIAKEIAFPKGLSLIFDQFCDTLDDASMMGSLVRVEKLFQEKLQANELKSAIDSYVQRKADEGVDESYFGSETVKGLRLLDILMRRYDVVLTNPPYMWSRNMNSAMAAFLNREYKKSNRDLYAAFIERCSELLSDHGRLAMITQQSFMFIGSYKLLRALLLKVLAVETFAHLGSKAFLEVQGEKVNTAMFVLRREPLEGNRSGSVGVYFRLVKERDPATKQMSFEGALDRWKHGLHDSHVYEYKQDDFSAIPNNPLVYWISPTLRSLFTTLPSLRDVAAAVFGSKTYDNFRFVRFWWEIGNAKITRDLKSWSDLLHTDVSYVPLMKSGSARWVGNERYALQLLDCGRALEEFLTSKNDAIRGKDFVFSPGISYSLVSSKTFSARLMPAGFIFDVSVPSFATSSPAVPLAILNSDLGLYLLKVLNPTINFPTGDVGRLPYKAGSNATLESLTGELIEFIRGSYQEDETAVDFVAPPNWPSGPVTSEARVRRVDELEALVNDEVYRIYEINAEDRGLIESELGELVVEDQPEETDQEVVHAEANQDIAILPPEELARRWIHYAVAVALGRFEPGIARAPGCGRFSADIAARLRNLADKGGIMVLDDGHPDDLARRVLDMLAAIYGDAETERIIRTAVVSGGPLRDALAAYLTGEFFRDHIRRYRKRPIYWLIQSSKKSYNIYLFHEKATPDTLALLRGKRYLGGRLNRLQQERASLSAAVLKGDSGAARKAGLVAEIIEELQEFDSRVEAATRVLIKDKDGVDATIRWEPELDDGVYINAAPLHELLPSWRDVNPKKAWQELAEGEYDWAKTAMRYWPQRVRAKCKDNRSYAIGHGLA